jgi:hypothetical protein
VADQNKDQPANVTLGIPGGESILDYVD